MEAELLMLPAEYGLLELLVDLLELVLGLLEQVVGLLGLELALSVDRALLENRDFERLVARIHSPDIE